MNPRDERAAARNHRLNLLQVPENPLGRAALIRSRSPSPAGPGEFNFPPLPIQPPIQPPIQQEQFENAEANNANNMGDQDTIRALTEALAGMKASSRKPELPAFDKNNVEIWVKRVDNAFRRAGITDSKDKFAHIEGKFAVDTDARIQAFIFGDGTEEEWTAFMQYLKDRYGKTKSQRASIILDGVKREGRLPSEMFAFVMEKIGTLTVDDLVREMVIRELPTEIQRTIHDQTKSLDGAATSKLADSYFDKDGKPIHRATSSVNNVENVPDLIDTEDETDDVNAVNRFRGKGRQFRPNQQQGRNPHSKTPWAAKPQQRNFGGQQQQRNFGAQQQQQNRPSFTPAFADKRENKGPSTLKDVKLCRYHKQFGDSAKTCESGCAMYPKWAGNSKAGRQA